MNVLYASDDNYAEIAGISMVSLLENNKNAGHIRFFMFDNGISSKNKENLSSVAGRYSREIVFIDVPDIEKLVGMRLDVGCWALAAFARLFAASLLPAEVEKIIYLDCDTMIRSSLLPLWNEDITGSLAAGCEDGIPVIHKQSIFLENTDIYVNTGVLFINVKAWRDTDIEKKFINFLKLFEGSLRYPDQDVLNGVLKNHIKLLSPKYNSMTFYFNYNPELFYYANIKDYYSHKELDEAKDAPVIVHFAGPGRKPWTKGNVHIYQEEYTGYRNMTPWKDIPEREPDCPVPEKREIILPLPVDKFFQEREIEKQIRPLIERANMRKKVSEVNLEDCCVK